MITSHYSGIKARCKKMRVKGFVKEHVKGQLTINNINEFIDYSLIEDTRLASARSHAHRPYSGR